MTSLLHILSAPARHGARRLALVAPPRLGPAAWAGYVAGVRVERAEALVHSDPAEAARLAESVAPVVADPGSTWRLAAAAHERNQDPEAAIHAVRRALERGERTVTTVLMRRRLAMRLRRPDEADEALAQLVETPPRNRKELERAVDALSDADPQIVHRYAAMVDGLAHITSEKRARLDELTAELRLAEAYRGDPEEFERARAHVLAHSTRPLRVVTQALVRCRAWDELAAFIATTPPNSRVIGPRGVRSGLPTAEIAKAAAAALTAGRATAASMLAARALVAKPADSDLQATFDNAHDQRSIARRGWMFPQRAESAYESDPQSVLAVLSQSLPIRSGGYATRSHGIITALNARGWSMQAVTRLGFPYDRWKATDERVVPAADVVDGVEYHRLLTPGRRAYPQFPLASYVDRCARGVESVARAGRAGLIHASSFYATGMAGLTAARRLGLPFIYEMRGLEELMRLSRDPQFDHTDRHVFLRRLETGVAAEAEAVFVITEALGREMADRGVDPDRIVVVPNGVHTDRFRPQQRDRELEAELGLIDTTVIGYVGSLVDYEGLEVLLAAVAGLKETRDDVRVIVVGDGPSERAVREQAQRLRVGDVVTFTGRVPHEQVARYLSLIDIAPFPRLPLPVCELISPIKPFEAMAMGTAVVVSDVAALTEFVEDGVTGRTFRKGDPADLRRVLEQLLDAADQRRGLGEAAREWVVRHRDWSAITTVVDHTYRRVLERVRLGDA